MWKCEICDYCTNSQSSFAPHRSGHVRKGEIPKRSIISREFICKICNAKFQTGNELRGHKYFHKPFEKLKKDYTRKQHLIFERGHKCEVCNFKEWMNKLIPIELDHIDGNPENNRKENLRLICPNCHAQTDTYKGRNIGKVTNSKRKDKLKKYYGKYR